MFLDCSFNITTVWSSQQGLSLYIKFSSCEKKEIKTDGMYQFKILWNVICFLSSKVKKSNKIL